MEPGSMISHPFPHHQKPLFSPSAADLVSIPLRSLSLLVRFSRMAELGVQRHPWLLRAMSTGLRQSCAKVSITARPGISIFWLRRVLAGLWLRELRRVIVLHLGRQVDGKLWGIWDRMGIRWISWRLFMRRSKKVAVESMACWKRDMSGYGL